MNREYDPGIIPAALQAVVSEQAFFVPVSLQVDASGLNCPLPLLKAKQGLRQLAAGDLLRVLATDAGSLKDFVSFAELTGQGLEAFAEDDGVYCYVIRKA